MRPHSSLHGGVMLLLLCLFHLNSIACYGDLSRSRLTAQAEHNLAGITSHAVRQATELVDSVVDDLLVLDSQNSHLMHYLNSFEGFLRISSNQTHEVLESFYDIVDIYLDADAAEKTNSIETQLIAFCLQRNGFDRWKRTIQMRTNQLLKSFDKKLQHHMESLDEEKRVPIEQRWRLIAARNGQRKLEKFRNFIEWLSR